MAHTRNRILESKITEYLNFWPVTGIVGLRQSGKTTLVTKLLNRGPALTLDDIDLRNEAISSPKLFLARIPRPAVIDEVQKAPPLFDAIKLLVDKKRVPGEFILTGSSSFSARIGIGESLTGRIGIAQLRPMTFAELHQKKMLPLSSLVQKIDLNKPRFTSVDVSKTMQTGGMPGVAFIRDPEHRRLYWDSWVETTITRDLPRLFKRNYDPDLAGAILHKIGQLLSDGELPSLHHFSQPARILRNYLSAMQEIFVLDRIPIHESGLGKDIWLLGDCGLASYLMPKHEGTEAQRSIIRHFLWNEWRVRQSFESKLPFFRYYKSAQGTPIDAVIDGIPILITADAKAVSTRLSWLERPVRGAMKTLKSNFGIIVAPVDRTITAKSNDGVAVVPWSAWC